MGDTEVRREDIEWCDIWIPQARASHLPRLLMVGDSITRAYFNDVEKTLKDRWLCGRLATSRSVCDRAFLKELNLVLDDYPVAMIHFNNGLHGWDYSESEYGEHLDQAVRAILERRPASRLVLATSTPVRRTGNLLAMDAVTARVIERNRRVAQVAARHHLPVNDLFAVIQDHPEHYSPDGVHLNSAGDALLGGHVGNFITTLL